MKVLVAKPAKAFKWNLLKEFVFEDDNGGSSSEHILGKVVGWKQEVDRYVWIVRFSDGDEEHMECEDLASALANSYIRGLDIVGPM